MGDAPDVSKLIDTLKVYGGCSPADATYAVAGKNNKQSVEFLRAIGQKLKSPIVTFTTDVKAEGGMSFSATYSRPHFLAYEMHLNGTMGVLQRATFQNKDGEVAELDFRKHSAKGTAVRGELEKKLSEFGFGTPHSAELLD